MVKRISARSKAVDRIGENNVQALENQGLKILWQQEYDMKEFVLSCEQGEDVLKKLDSVSDS